MQRNLQGLTLKLGLGVAMLWASAGCCVAQGAAVTGVVRDSAGVAQMGVLVQVMAADSSSVLRAFTDLRGRYLISNLTPGSYQVQATGALFVPAMRQGLRLRSGARVIVNLTMSAIFETATWLPAERRRADEPSDDWLWTLRSAANRPILRIVDDGQLVMVSSSRTENHVAAARGRAAVTGGDGGFGRGGTHSVLTVDTVQPDGLGTVVRADTGSGRPQFGVAPSTELSAGFERQTGFVSTTRAVVSFQSHPELVSGGTNGAGLQAVEIASAQRTKLGDLVNLEAGGVVYAVHGEGYGFASLPFFRVMVEPSSAWGIGYRMATSRNVQSFAGLNAVEQEMPVSANAGKKARMERGRHQEIAVAQRSGRGQVQVAFYKDRLQNVVLAGGGVVSRADRGTAAVVADTTTNTFRLVTDGYSAQGVNVMVTQPLGGTMWAAAEYSTGSALGPLAGGTGAPSLPAVLAGLHRVRGESATFALKGTLPDTGTRIRAVYRWQPSNLLTAIDCYREFSDQAFLSFHVRQPVRWQGVLPSGLEASVDVTNLLAQGYQPFVSSDGRTLYLAQSPKTLQAGLSLTF